MKPPEQVSDSVRRLNPEIYGVPSYILEAQQAIREDKLRDEVLQEIRDRVWKAFYGTTARATGRTLGEPDIICAADRGRTFYIELKTKTGKLSTDQQAVHAHLRKLGHEVFVVRSLQEFKEIVDDRA